MYNRQLRNNIKSLDAQIGALSKELEGLKKDTKYDVKVRTLSDLIEFRSKLASNKENEKSDVIIELDRQIEELTRIVGHLESDEVYIAKIKKLEDLTKIRCLLSEARAKESKAPVIISGLFGLSAIGLVLYYEKTEIVTSKAMSIATKMFKGV